MGDHLLQNVIHLQSTFTYLSNWTQSWYPPMGKYLSETPPEWNKVSVLKSLGDAQLCPPVSRCSSSSFYLPVSVEKEILGVWKKWARAAQNGSRGVRGWGGVGGHTAESASAQCRTPKDQLPASYRQTWGSPAALSSQFLAMHHQLN